MYNEIISILVFVKLNQQQSLKVNKSKKLIIQINKIKAKILIHHPIHLRHYLYIIYFVLGLFFFKNKNISLRNLLLLVLRNGPKI